MRVLRWMLIFLIAGCILWCAANVRWTGRLETARTSYSIAMGEAPIWAPPSPPSMEQFRRSFSSINEPEVAADLASVADPPSIRCQPDYGHLLFAVVVLLWPVLLVMGIVYRVVRGPRRDLLLQIALCIGICITVSAVVSVGLWFVVGGWGPAFVSLALIGMFVGLLWACVNYNDRVAKLVSVGK